MDDFPDYDPPPPSLFRYRPAGFFGGDPILARTMRDRARQMIVARTLYFPSAASLNDPFELRPRISMGFTPAERHLYESDIKRRRFRRDSSAKWKDSRTLFRHRVADPAFLAQAYDKRRGQYGIVCLTEPNDSLLMWTYYAGGHAGYCVEFSFTPPDWAHTLPFRVTYSECRPTIELSDIFRPRRQEPRYVHEFVKKVFLTKSAEWQHEREWRILSEEPGSILTLRSGVIRSVILGARMQDADRSFLAALVRDSGQPAQLVESVLDEVRYGLRFAPVSTERLLALASQFRGECQ